MNHAAVRPPFVKPVRSPPSESSEGHGLDRQPLRVLIIEDEAVLAMDMEESLTQAGFEIVGVADSEDEAVSLVGVLRPDLVLMDITLRIGDGIAAAKAIADRTKIVFVSASSDPATLSAAEALHPLGFIRKPYSGHELPTMLKRMLRLDTGH